MLKMITDDELLAALARRLRDFERADAACVAYHEEHPDAADPPNEMLWTRDDSGVDVANALAALLSQGYELRKK